LTGITLPPDPEIAGNGDIWRSSSALAFFNPLQTSSTSNLPDPNRDPIADPRPGAASASLRVLFPASGRARNLFISVITVALELNASPAPGPLEFDAEI
jgi:hypothetical protein